MQAHIDAGHSPARLAPLGPRSIKWFVLAGLVFAAGGFFWWASPGVKLHKSSTGLAAYQLTGLGARIQSARFLHAGSADQLVSKGGALMPTHHISVGESGYVDVRVAGPAYLRWLPWERAEAVTSIQAPRLPQVSTSMIHRGLSKGLVVPFNERVSAVRYRLAGGAWHTLALNSASSTVRLPLPKVAPGQEGTVEVSGRARTWERWAPHQTVPWKSTPYIHAMSTHSGKVSLTGRLIVRFSQPVVHPHLSAWQVSPHVTGTWSRVNHRTFAFTPQSSYGYGPGALIAVKIPSGTQGPQANTGSVLASTTTLKWKTAPGSVLRLQQLLAQEGYLPVSWTARTPGSSQSLTRLQSTIYHPPSGTFQWKYNHLPHALEALWTPGQMSIVTQGAIMQFERANGLPVDGIAGPDVWKALLRDRLANRVSPWPYTYISVTESHPETLELWVNNQLVMTTLTNTGIPATPTYLGTSPIYERLTFQIMRGKNPNGTRYADPVYWINYFKGGDAVHGFVRASYGFPQSLGCVEVRPSTAQKIYRQVHYGTLVTVNPVGVPPAPKA